MTADTSGVQAGVWAFGEIDITSGGLGDGGAAIPAMHLPVSVLSTAPAAHMSIDQSTLSFVLTQGAMRHFPVHHQQRRPGDPELETVHSGGRIHPILDGSQAAASAVGKPLSVSTIWDQASSGMNGFGSDFFTPDHHGVYAAYTFSIPLKADIAEIVAPGFAETPMAWCRSSGTVNWYI